MNTTVLSARVPTPFANELRSYCKNHNTTVSEYMQDGFKRVGMMELGDVIIPDETEALLLAVGGGSMIAILVYKAVKTVLEEKDFVHPDHVEIFAVGAGMLAGILSAYGIDKLIKTSK